MFNKKYGVVFTLVSFFPRSCKGDIIGSLHDFLISYVSVLEVGRSSQSLGVFVRNI